MAFKKAKVQQRNTESNVDWKAYNEHCLERIQSAIEEEGSNLVCFVSGLVDTGTQPPQEEYTEYDWEDSEQQNKLLKADFGCYEDGNKFYIPNSPVDSMVVMIDFPDIMIDYGEFFEGGKTAPYRALLNGDWKGVAGITALAPAKDGYTTKSNLSKIAKATGAYSGTGKVPADFDIGEILGIQFMMTVEASMGGDENQFLNVKISSPAAKSKKIPDVEHDIEPFTVLMDGGNDEESLKQLRYSVIKRLELAKEWEDSGLKKELDKLGRLGNSSSSEEDNSSKTKPEKVTSKKAPKKEEPEEEESDDSDDDENPFAED